ncbi:MAG: hypothetical protein KF799_09170 [Bdellovibrionales bacterium]|nr:hypothetical protein [Bdellovibrionales bacterium]
MMLKTFIALTAISFTLTVQAGQVVKPDPHITYGELCNPQDRDFLDHRYSEQIAYCVRNVGMEQKARIYKAYGIPEHCRKYYTIDHFIPLALGGSNHDVNLWPEHRYVKATRRFLEQNLFDQMRRGEITQTAAMEIIVDAKMNPQEPKPWKCGVASNNLEFGPAVDEDQD